MLQDTLTAIREGVTVDLPGEMAFGGPSVGVDKIVGGVSQIRGSNFGDLLIGTNQGSGSTQIYEGRGGNDTIIGNGGFDQADGRPGDPRPEHIHEARDQERDPAPLGRHAHAPGRAGWRRPTRDSI